MALKLVVIALVAVAVYGQAPPPPPFLEKAPPAKVAEFNQLLASSGGLTDAAINAKVAGWIAQQDASIKSAYAAFEAEVKKAQSQGDAAHQAAISKFSAAAKAADAKLTAIADNPALTVEQKGQQIDALLKSLPPNVRQEIEQAMQG